MQSTNSGLVTNNIYTKLYIPYRVDLVQNVHVPITVIAPSALNVVQHYHQPLLSGSWEEEVLFLLILCSILLLAVFRTTQDSNRLGMTTKQLRKTGIVSILYSMIFYKYFRK